MRGADGQVDGVLLLVSDVTAQVRDRRQQEALAAQLATTQERYQTLFETLPQGVIYYDTNGLILGANPAACQILGLDEDEMITWPLVAAGHAVRDDGSPLDPADFPVSVALRTGEVVTDVIIGFPHGRTGEMRWLRITAVPDSRDEKGRPQRAYAMFRDLTKERRAAAALREGTELMGRLREANVIGVVVNGDDHVHDANDAFLGIIGYTREDVEAGRISRESITPPEWWEADADAHRQLTRTGAFRPYEKEYVHRDGHRVPVLVGAAVIGYDPLRWVTYVVDLTARQRAEQERAFLLASERTARAEADSAQERVAFLLQAGDLVAAAQDRHELLQHAAQLVVHSLADFCLAFLPGPAGELRAISIAHREPGGGVEFTDLRGEPVPAVGKWTVADRVHQQDDPGGPRRRGPDGPPPRGLRDAARHRGPGKPRARRGHAAHGRPGAARRARRRPLRRPSRLHGHRRRGGRGTGPADRRGAGQRGRVGPGPYRGRDAAALRAARHAA